MREGAHVATYVTPLSLDFSPEGREEGLSCMREKRRTSDQGGKLGTRNRKRKMGNGASPWLHFS